MTLTRRAALGAAVAAAALPAAADDAVIRAKDLLGDAAILEAAYRAMHPGLMRYLTPAGVDRLFAGLRAGFAHPRTAAEAYLALSRATAAIRCGHSFANPSNQKRTIRASLFGGATRLPFRFTWIGGRMVVLKAFVDIPALRPGAVVEAVNGVPASAMLTRLAPFTRADGHNDARRVRNLEVRGDGEWEDFDVLAPLLWPSLSGQARLTIDGQTVEAPLQTAQDRDSQRGDPEHMAGPAFTLERMDGGIARLIMPTWALYDSPWDWKAWLAGTLDGLAEEKTRGLIIDLRGNGGGLDVGDVILSRLIDRDLELDAMVRKVRYRKAPASLDPYLDTWDMSFKDWGDKAIGPDAAGFYRFTRWEEDGNVVRPQGRRFGGKVAVLMDASNASATFQFTARVKDNGLGALVGQTNGGNRRGINGGAFFFLRLPGSNLEVDLPLVGTFPAHPQPDAGVEPEIAVHNSPADIGAGRDRELEAAVRAVGG